VEFILASVGMLGFIVLALVMLGRSYPGSGSDLLDWTPTQSYEQQALLEADDIAQMIEAQNKYRRRRGAEDLTQQDAEDMARHDNLVRRRGGLSAAAGGGDGELDELDGIDPERLKQLEDELGA
jgi:hypothetical protein